MRALKIAGAAIGAVIVVIALLLVIGIPSGFLTAQIQERVERETGYKLAINGGAKIGLWPSLNITLNDVTLQDPKDRDINRRFAAASIEADVTLASLWAGKPQITELVIIRPVVNLPLRRERDREANPPSKPAAGKASRGFLDRACQRQRRHDRALQPARPRREQDRDRQRRHHHRCRPQDRADRQRPPQRLSAEIRDQGGAARSRRSSGRTSRPRSRSTRPACCTRRSSAKAEVRLNGSVVMINGVTGTLGDAAFNGWASVDLSSKPLVKLDLDFQKLAVATARSTRQYRRRSPGAVRRSTSTASTISTLQARISAAELNIGDARFAPAAIDATLASGVLKAQVSNLGAYDGNANGDLTVDVSTANPDLRDAGRPHRRARAAAAAGASPISTSSTARCRRRSACAPPAPASARSCRTWPAPPSSCSRTAPSRGSTSRR